MAQMLEVISTASYVHSDIKPENITVQFDKQFTRVESIHLIDFGSSFVFDDAFQFTGTTPEYLSPEMIHYSETLRQNPAIKEQMSKKLVEMSKNWSLDVWSFGVILLEIISGFPVWMQLKCKMQLSSGKPKVGQGIFGVRNRDPVKIIEAQQKLMKNLSLNMKKLDNYQLTKIPEFMDLLKRMLEVDPANRISPSDIKEHPFVKLYGFQK